MADQENIPNSNGSLRENLQNLANTFSDEAQDSAKQKMIASSFRLDRGEIPFDETLINLSQARDVLLNGTSTGSVTQIPLRIQRNLVSAAHKVSAQLVSMSSGADAVVPFVSAVDELVDALWCSNLQNMSGELLGFHEKINQLKTLENKLKQLEQRAKLFESAEGKAFSSLETIAQAVGSSEKLRADIAAKAESSAAELDKLTQAQATAAAALASTQQSEKNSLDSAISARTISSEVTALKTHADQTTIDLDKSRADYTALLKEMADARKEWDTAIRTAHATQTASFEAAKLANESERTILNTLSTEKQTALESSISSTLSTAVTAFTNQTAAQIAASKATFEAESTRIISENKSALSVLELRSKSLVANNEQDVTERMKKITELELVFSEKIRLATNFQLFHSFDTRQKAIAVSVKYWQKALFIGVGASVLISLLFVGWILLAGPTYNAAFFLKLSFTIPLVYAIHFCSARFSEERRLEEEYAFKSNISISLEPYRELVERLVNKADPAEATKYLDFVLSSIDKVFSSPMQSNTLTPIPSGTAVESVKDASQGITKVISSVSDLIQSVGKLK